MFDATPPPGPRAQRRRPRFQTAATSPPPLSHDWRNALFDQPNAGVVLVHCGDHRGNPGLEHTIAEFHRAAASGADGVEIAIRSAGGELVICRDPRIGGLLVAAHTPHQLDLLTRVRVTRLDDALEYLARLELLVDFHIKEPRIAVEVARAATRLPAERILITSFLPAALAAVHRELPRLQTGLLLPGAAALRPIAAIRRARAVGANALLPHRRAANRIIAGAARFGIPIIPWIVNAAHDLDRLRGRAAGVITDEPGVALDRLHGSDIEGGRVQIRVLRRHQVGRVIEFVGSLSPATFRARFHGAHPTERQLRGLDGVHVVALDSQTVVGWTFAARHEGTEYEVAAVVADEWQDRAVLRAMLARLEEALRAQGVTSLRAVVDPDDWRLIMRLGRGWTLSHEDSSERVYRRDL